MNYLRHIFGAYLATLLEEHADKMTSYVREFAEEGKGSTSADFVASLETTAEMYLTLGPILEKFDVLICPTNATTSVAADHDHTKDKVLINGKEVSPTLGWAMTTPFNMQSRCPVLSVP